MNIYSLEDNICLQCRKSFSKSKICNFFLTESCNIIYVANKKSDKIYFNAIIKNFEIIMYITHKM